VGWSIGFDSNWNRDIGYGVPATCDAWGCKKKIDRGLAHVCGGEPYGGERGCGLYFCSEHLWETLRGTLCNRCVRYQKPYKPKPDLKEWIDFKMTDPSWEEWRKSAGKEGR